MTIHNIESNGSIREIQEQLLIILKEFDRICVDNDIEYTLAFGTALGARRNASFIPWDDDIDVQVDIPNYHKLLRVLDSDLTDAFDYECFETDERYNIMLPDLKIRLKGTTIEERAFSLKSGTDSNGLFLDVFVLHSISENKVIHWIHRMVSKILLLPIYFITQLNSNPIVLKRMLTNYSKWYDKKNNTSEDVYLSLCWSHHTFKDIRMKKSDIFPGKRVRFEDGFYPVPHHLDAYLKSRYGPNYMTPPQEFLQRPSHIKRVDSDEV